MMIKGRIALVIASVLALILWSQPQNLYAAEPSMGDYTCYPVTQANQVAPNILIIMDNSGSMNFQAYYGSYDHNTKYYGYFEPYKKYSYEGNKFVRDPNNGDWDGNFLNWLTMRRVDVLRKVLMGGKATSRQGTGNTTCIGEDPAQSNRAYTKSYQDTDNVTPFSSGSSYNYYVDDGNFYAYANWRWYRYHIKVKKDMNAYPDEAYNFHEGNLAGVLQKIGDRARWGNEFFNYGTGNNESGGYIENTVGDANMSSLVTSIQNTGCDTWTPLAESYYVAMQYFKQEDIPNEKELDYPNNTVPNENLGDDPYHNGSEYVECAKSFVLFLTDGASTKDVMDISGAAGSEPFKDYDNDNNDPGNYASDGSDYLDDIALYARTHDLRGDLDGDQNLILYTVYAFGSDESARLLLQDAAKNGGFVDKDGDNKPDEDAEWDEDGDGVPDTYYEADSGYQLEAEIIQAINDILERAASGTGVSVLATTAEGEGTLVQAYYRPTITTGLKEAKWVGYLHSLMVDPYGNLREDTDGDHGLDVTKDKLLVSYFDEDANEAQFKRYDVSETNPYPDEENDPHEKIALEDAEALWSAGEILSQRSPGTRKIFTYIDQDNDDVVDDPGDDPFDHMGECRSFHTTSSSEIKPYLGVKDDATWGHLGATHDERVENIIDFTRGNEVAGLRERTVDGNEWKLGDIVNSTPVSVSRPTERFDVIYSDESYSTYFKEFKDRETVVYVGANDGMLHAFTSWKYDSSSGKFIKPSTAPSGEEIGDELWAYIPQNLLSHLKWLADPDYTHVFYVDQKPKVFDAKILPDDTHYTDDDTEDNWGTILICGFRMGGGYIWSEGDYDNDGTDETRDFYPAYVCMDITDPRNPRVLWERTYQDLHKTTSRPAVVKVKDKWFAVFGSGPEYCDGTSNSNGHIFVVDLKTGDPYRNETENKDWLFETAETQAFMNSPVSFDKGLNYNVDAVYFGESYEGSSTWEGKVYKVTIPWADLSGNYDGSDTSNYSDNPKDSNNPWQLSALFDVGKPVTAQLSLSIDEFDNVWVYGGTGRHFSDADEANTDTQYLFGVKDPFYNQEHQTDGFYSDDYYHNYSQSLELQTDDLFDSTDYVVSTSREVYEKTGGGYQYWGTFDYLLATIHECDNDLRPGVGHDGWIRSLEESGERVLKKPAVLGGLVLVPSFIPSLDVCEFGGRSYLWSLYYETGTPFFKPVFRTEGTYELTIDGEVKEMVQFKVELGRGKASETSFRPGKEEGGVTAYTHLDALIDKQAMNPAKKIKSGLTSWRER